ncbi:Zinc finger C2H2 [Penicillium brevicompactum]|uniref:Zinc finger C2H2 n=1 Tax=Penicillium brevicompactum TaxID=5074 RepID=A0A9W9UU92_PENBR|nr:Zinc finger C2H2 [Penicillium brevicompactum]
MSWPGYSFNIPETSYSWSENDRNWEARPTTQPQAFPMYSYPNLSVTAPFLPSASPSHNFDPRLPPTPGSFEPMLSPTPSSVSSGCYLDPNPMKGNIGHRHLAPTSGTIVSSTSHYDPRCASPWTDSTTSPIPSSDFLNPTPTKRTSGEEEPHSVFDSDMGAALTPASLCDPSPSPRACLTSSSGPDQQATHADGASNLPSGENKDYGTYQCNFEGCTYDRLFSRKGVLKRHIQTQHLNPGGFKCPQCDHASSRKENMKAHRQAVHKERFL